jgi:serine/threonine protein kinase
VLAADSLRGGHSTSPPSWTLQMVMEYCAAGSVSDILRVCKTTLTEDQIAIVCKSALRGLKYLHDNMKLHRDIKAGNILLSSTGEAKLGTGKPLRSWSLGVKAGRSR